MRTWELLAVLTASRASLRLVRTHDSGIGVGGLMARLGEVRRLSRCHAVPGGAETGTESEPTGGTTSSNRSAPEGRGHFPSARLGVRRGQATRTWGLAAVMLQVGSGSWTRNFLPRHRLRRPPAEPCPKGAGPQQQQRDSHLFKLRRFPVGASSDPRPWSGMKDVQLLSVSHVTRMPGRLPYPAQSFLCISSLKQSRFRSEQSTMSFHTC